MNKLAPRLSALPASLAGSTITVISLLAAISVVTAAESPAIPAPWSEVLQPAYGEWRVVSIWRPFEHSRPTKDLTALVEMATKSMREGKTQPNPSYTDVESKGKCLPVYYESGPRKQVCVSASRYGSAAEATAAYDKEVARSLKPASSETLDYRVVKKGQHKDGAGQVLGRWTLLESNFKGQFAEKAYWTQGEYLFDAETTTRDFRTAWEPVSKDASGKTVYGAPRNGPTPAWEPIRTEEETEQFLRGTVENFLAVALKR